MIGREDFIFTLGFEGSVAIVDGRAKKKYRKYTALQLAEAGLYKPAISAAVYDDDADALDGVLAVYNREADGPLSSTDELKRLFGVTQIPKEISKVSVY